MHTDPDCYGLQTCDPQTDSSCYDRGYPKTEPLPTGPKTITCPDGTEGPPCPPQEEEKTITCPDGTEGPPCPRNDINIINEVPKVKQSGSTCWLACAAMMQSWRDGKKYTENDIAKILVEKLGKSFFEGQSPDETVKKLDKVMNTLGLIESGYSNSNPINPSRISELVREYGPLLAVSAFPGSTLQHVVIVTGIETLAQNRYDIVGIDPITAAEFKMDYPQFQSLLEQSQMDLGSPHGLIYHYR